MPVELIDPETPSNDPDIQKQLEDQINILNRHMEEHKDDIRKDWCWRASMEYMKLFRQDLTEEEKRARCDDTVKDESLWKNLKVEIGMRPNPNYIPPAP